MHYICEMLSKLCDRIDIFVSSSRRNSVFRYGKEK